MKVAIVSTHRRWAGASQAWARYHLALGFDRIYAFADDGRIPDPPPPPAVDLTLCTQAYWSSHRPHHRFAAYLVDILRDADTPQWGSPERVMQRQILNACVALERAAAEGIDWLLHIDDDEYFWLPSASLGEHFAGLRQACVALALYWNHEAVLFDGEVPSLRHPRSLFKKHPATLTLEQKQAIGSVLPGKPYFTSHWSGKTAARVLPGTLPDGVHMFEVETRVRGEASFTGPGVLHRPYSSAAQFCDKHLSQGRFSTEQVFGKPWTPPGVFAEAQQLCRDGDLQGLRALYARAVTLTPVEVDRLLAGGYLIEPDAALPIDDRALDAAPTARSPAAA